MILKEKKKTTSFGVTITYDLKPIYAQNIYRRLFPPLQNTVLVRAINDH